MFQRRLNRLVADSYFSPDIVIIIIWTFCVKLGGKNKRTTNEAEAREVGVLKGLKLPLELIQPSWSFLFLPNSFFFDR